MATASNNRDKHITFDADFKEDFTEGMLRMLSEGSSNDVRIILNDGEVTANKDVLAAQCQYFAANFGWKKITKDDSDHLEITDCSKEVMERIIKYLFTGTIKFKDLSLLKLLELLNQVRKMLLKGDLQDLIESYIKDDVISLETLEKVGGDQDQEHNLCTDIVRGLAYVDRFVIESVKVYILGGILLLLPAIAKDDEAISAFSTLPCQVVKELLSMLISTLKKDTTVSPPTSYRSAQLRCLLAWYNQNKDMCQEDKEEILGTIDLDSLPAADLFEIVKPSGLFPDDEVDKRIVKCLRESDQMKKNLCGN